MRLQTHTHNMYYLMFYTSTTDAKMHLIVMICYTYIVYFTA